MPPPRLLQVGVFFLESLCVKWAGQAAGLKEWIPPTRACIIAPRYGLQGYSRLVAGKKKARSFLARFFLPATYAPFAFKPSALRNHAGVLAKMGRPHLPALPLAPLPRARAFCPRSRSFCPAPAPAGFVPQPAVAPLGAKVPPLGAKCPALGAAARFSF